MTWTRSKKDDFDLLYQLIRMDACFFHFKYRTQERCYNFSKLSSERVSPRRLVRNKPIREPISSQVKTKRQNYVWLYGSEMGTWSERNMQWSRKERKKERKKCQLRHFLSGTKVLKKIRTVTKHLPRSSSGEWCAVARILLSIHSYVLPVPLFSLLLQICTDMQTTSPGKFRDEHRSVHITLIYIWDSKKKKDKSIWILGIIHFKLTTTLSTLSKREDRCSVQAAGTSCT